MGIAKLRIVLFKVLQQLWIKKKKKLSSHIFIYLVQQRVIFTILSGLLFGSVQPPPFLPCILNSLYAKSVHDKDLCPEAYRGGVVRVPNGSRKGICLHLWWSSWQEKLINNYVCLSSLIFTLLKLFNQIREVLLCSF